MFGFFNKCKNSEKVKSSFQGKYKCVCVKMAFATYHIRGGVGKKPMITDSIAEYFWTKRPVGDHSRCKQRWIEWMSLDVDPDIELKFYRLSADGTEYERIDD